MLYVYPLNSHANSKFYSLCESVITCCFWPLKGLRTNNTTSGLLCTLGQICYPNLIIMQMLRCIRQLSRYEIRISLVNQPLLLSVIGLRLRRRHRDGHLDLEPRKSLALVPEMLHGHVGLEALVAGRDRRAEAALEHDPHVDRVDVFLQKGNGREDQAAEATLVDYARLLKLLSLRGHINHTRCILRLFSLLLSRKATNNCILIRLHGWLRLVLLLNFDYHDARRIVLILILSEFLLRQSKWGTQYSPKEGTLKGTLHWFLLRLLSKSLFRVSESQTLLDFAAVT